MSYVIPQVNAAADTFQIWLDRTNQALGVLATQALTANSSANGGYTNGNAYLNGTFGSLVVATKVIRGGNTVSSANLQFASNAVFGNTDHGIFLGTNGTIDLTDKLNVGNSSVNTAITPSQIKIGGSADRLTINTTAITGTDFHFVTNADSVRASVDGTLMGIKGGLNFIAGDNITITATDNAASGSVDLLFDAIGASADSQIANVELVSGHILRITLTDARQFDIDLSGVVTARGIQSVTVIAAGKIRITYTDATTQDLSFPGAGAITSNTTYNLTADFAGNLNTAAAFFKSVVITSPALVTLKLPAETRTFSADYDLGGLERVVLQGDTSGTLRLLPNGTAVSATIHSAGVYWATIPVGNSAGFAAGDIVSITATGGTGGWLGYLGPHRVVSVANSSTITVAIKTSTTTGKIPSSGTLTGGKVKKMTTIWKPTTLTIGSGSRLGGLSDIVLDGSGTANNLALYVQGEVLGFPSSDANTTGVLNIIDFVGITALNVFGPGSKYIGGVAVSGTGASVGGGGSIQVGGEAYFNTCITNFSANVGIYAIFGAKLTLQNTQITGCNQGIACGHGSRTITGSACSILGNNVDVLADTLGYVYGGGLDKTGISVSPAFDTFSGTGAYIASS